MPRPSPACCPDRTDRCYRGSPSGCLSRSSYRRKSSRKTRWCRRRASAQTNSAARLSSPAGCRSDRKGPPAPRHCSLWPLPPIPDDPGVCTSSSFSAAARRLCRLRCDTSRAGDGTGPRGFPRRSALRPGRPPLSSATATSGRSWR